MKKLLFVLLTAAGLSAGAQMDVQHYDFTVRLEDGSDRISGSAWITVQLTGPASEIVLDLIGPKEGGKGMTVRAAAGKEIKGFRQSGDKVYLQLLAPGKAGQLVRVGLEYDGVPADGLIISKNKYGDRTFFSDHWPNRARHWLPCHDTPADKATVAFYVVAPEHYRVVANGLYDSAYTRAASDTNTARGTVHYWKEATPIPTKVMAVGVARFAVQRVDSAYKVPVTAWVYPRDSAKGVFDYSVADDILRFFDNYVGSFAFSKLANVQSKTIFGGMENAGAIFYAENTVTGNRSSEGLVAHEVAHQWFGNMATEKSFAHLWLSEGFATYMTNVYWEAAHGREAFVKKMQEEREEVVRFARRWNKPVVDTASDLMNLLNANSYQKGGWVLHMLRQEAGDEVFRNIVRTYYDTYKGRNADTRDFQQVAEQVSGKNLDTFFRQWLYTPGHPRLQASWRLEGNSLRLTILQQQDSTFRFPLTVGFKNGNTLARRLTIDIVESTQIISVDMKAMGFRPTDIVLDPDTQLLFEGKVSGRAE